MNNNLQTRADFIKSILKDCGEMMLEVKDIEVHSVKAGANNFATQTDVKIENYIREQINKNFPDDLILGEETDFPDMNSALEMDSLWIIDPIDGTINFAKGRNYACTSISYTQKGEVMVTGVYNPYADELYFAQKDVGAFLNGKKLKISDEFSEENFMLGIDFYYEKTQMRKALEMVLKFETIPQVSSRGSGILANCDVACSRINGYFYINFMPWDTASCILIVREAGGVVKDFSGKDINFLSPQIVSGNKKAVEYILSQINKASS